jgi:hypothetical protein
VGGGNIYSLIYAYILQTEIGGRRRLMRRRLCQQLAKNRFRPHYHGYVCSHSTSNFLTKKHSSPHLAALLANHHPHSQIE